MAVALVDLLVGGVEVRAGDEIPARVSFAGSVREIDVAGLVERGVAKESPPARRRKPAADAAG